MSAEDNDVGTVNIHRLHPLYLVPSDHPAPDAVRSRLDDVAQRELPLALARAISHALPESACDVWLIRSLNVTVDLNLDTSEEQLAGNWAREAAITLHGVLEGSADAD